MPNFIHDNLALSIFIMTLLGAIVTQLALYIHERRAARPPISPITDESFKSATSRGTAQVLRLVAPVARPSCGKWLTDACIGCESYGRCAANGRSL